MCRPLTLVFRFELPHRYHTEYTPVVEAFFPLKGFFNSPDGNDQITITGSKFSGATNPTTSVFKEGFDDCWNLGSSAPVTKYVP